MLQRRDQDQGGSDLCVLLDDLETLYSVICYSDRKIACLTRSLCIVASLSRGRRTRDQSWCVAVSGFKKTARGEARSDRCEKTLSRMHWKEEELKRSGPTIDVRRRAYDQFKNSRLSPFRLKGSSGIGPGWTRPLFCSLPSSSLFALVSSTALTAETMPCEKAT